MANGTYIIGTNGSLQARIVWSSVSNGTTANSSDVTVELQIKKDSSIPTWGTWSGSITIDYITVDYKGEKYEVYASVSDNWVTLVSHTKTVIHGSDGSGSARVRVVVTPPSNTTLSGKGIDSYTTITLDKIPQHAYLTGINSTTFDSINSAPIIYYTNPAGNDLDSLQACISLDKANDDIKYRDIPKTENQYKFVISDDDLNMLYNKMPNSNGIRTYVFIRSVIGDLVKYTYDTKTFFIKDKSINLNFDVIDSNSDTAALTGDNHTFIRGYSKASYSFSASPATIGSTIASLSVKNGETTLTAAAGEFAAIDNTSFTISATDTRGNTSTETINKAIIDYIPLTCSLTVNMPNIDGEAAFNVTGNYFNGSFGAVNNQLTVLVRQVISGVESEWKPVNYTVSGDTFSADGTLSGFSQETECKVEVKVFDKLLTKIDSQKVLIIPVFDWSMDDFNFNVPVTIKGDLTVKGGISFDYGAQDLLWTGQYTMLNNQTAQLSKPLSEQANGVVLIFSKYDALDSDWHSFFIPKKVTQLNNGGAHNFIMAASNFSAISIKTLYLYENYIKGDAANEASGNNNGITYNNGSYVLRYVIGV